MKLFAKGIDRGMTLCYNIGQRAGEVSEWFKELVLKTSDPARDQEFESLPLRQIANHFFKINIDSCTAPLEKYPSGEGAPLLRE